jgi:hypothetical protein
MLFFFSFPLSVVPLLLAVDDVVLAVGRLSSLCPDVRHVRARARLRDRQAYYSGRELQASNIFVRQRAVHDTSIRSERKEGVLLAAKAGTGDAVLEVLAAKVEYGRKAYAEAFHQRPHHSRRS